MFVFLSKLAAIHYPNALLKNRHIVPLFKQGHRCGSKEEWRCTHTIGIVSGIITTIQIHTRMPACHIDGVALQPPFSTGVVFACANMVQPCEGDILVPIRAVPQKRLLKLNSALLITALYQPYRAQVRG